jgi:beta-1,4-mannosyl-glycoprotein beta-1,4-N-acetylglucosaminyltransferase
MFYDESVILNIRLNYLDKFVDKFVIVESKYAHNGEKRRLLFDIKNYKKFAKKIIYLVVSEKPKGLISIKNKKIQEINSIKILNAIKRENFQRNYIFNGIKNVSKDDLIIISDIDEIPKLDFLNFSKILNKIYIFEQKFFYYKLNLFDPKVIWYGSRMCKFSELLSPQWLRNIKAKNYPFWRLDVLFSKNKYFNNVLVKDGGWHFSYLKNSLGIKKKLRTYLHHNEYDLNPINIKKINNIIKSKKAIYDLNLDQRADNRFLTGNKLRKFNFNLLPSYIQDNKAKFNKWLYT